VVDHIQIVSGDVVDFVYFGVTYRT
jgi:hypothetical protein